MKHLFLCLLALAVIAGGAYLIDNEKYFIAFCVALIASLLGIINGKLHEIRGLLKNQNN